MLEEKDTPTEEAAEVTETSETTPTETTEETATEEPTAEAETAEEAKPSTETAEVPAKTAGDTDGSEDDVDELEEEAEAVEESAHDDFDWSRTQKDELNYTKEEIAKYLNDYESSISSLKENDIVKGKVTTISNGDVVLDINFKSDGLVSLSEFRDMPDLAVGDTVDVYVESQEDERGQLILSRRKAKLLKAWDNIVDSYENGSIIKGLVVSKTKGGLIADCSGLETFLPGSQIDIKPVIDYDSYVGKTMEFKVVKINENIKNAVVSHKALIESDLAEQRDQIIAGLEKGQVLEGIVKNITDFGAFMDLGGIDGLLYITDISWGRIDHPNEVLELNEKVNVVVLDFDENKKRISLGLKQLQPHPWDVLDKEVGVGSVLKGKIVNIEDYGAFLEITPGVEGLIHVSEVSWSNQPVNAREYFQQGIEFETKVVTIDREDRKMSLSLKQLTPDPWETIDAKFPVESRHTGQVKNLTPYGVFVELEEGIGGMVHISDLSWTKRYGHPSEFTKVGNDIEVMILEIDRESRKLSLGHKQIEENPWDTFENVFPVGSFHEATIIKKEDRGAIVQLPYGLEAFAPIKHIRKEDGKTAEVDEVLTVKVIEFNRDDKRILVSHLRYLEDLQREATDQVRSDGGGGGRSKSQSPARGRRRDGGGGRDMVRKQQKSLEKTTLGDLSALAELKVQLDENASAAKKAAAEAAAPAETKEVKVAKTETPSKEVTEVATEKVVEATKEVTEEVVKATEEVTEEVVEATEEVAAVAEEAAIETEEASEEE